MARIEHISELELSLYLDNELDREQRQVVEEHLTGCQYCRSYLEDMEESASLIEGLEAEMPITPADGSLEEVTEEAAAIGSHPAGYEISAYIDGELPARQLREVRSHIASCPECRAMHESLRNTAMFFTVLDIHAPELVLDARILGEASAYLALQGSLEDSLPAAERQAVSAVILRDEASERERAKRFASDIMAEAGEAAIAPAGNVSVFPTPIVAGNWMWLAAAAAIIAFLAIANPFRITVNFFGGYRTEPLAIAPAVNMNAAYAPIQVSGARSSRPDIGRIIGELRKVLRSSDVEDEKSSITGQDVVIVLRFRSFAAMTESEAKAAVAADVAAVFSTIYGGYSVDSATIWLMPDGAEKPNAVISFDRYGRPLEKDWKAEQSGRFSGV